jgi:hypothetical protein
MRSAFKKYGLAFVLAALFLVSWGGQAWSGWLEFQSEQAEHGQPAQVLGSDGYLWTFLHATLENWQSEFLQLLTFVVLTAHLVFRGSPESKDADAPIIERLEELRAEIRALKSSAASGAPRAAARHRED